MFDWGWLLDSMEAEARRRGAPVYRKERVLGGDPFRIFVFAFLSSRTRDETTIRVVKRLFQRVESFEDIASMDPGELEELLRGIGFYREKARNLVEAARMIVERYRGRVPDSLEKLLEIRGVGVKIAKLVLNEAYGKPLIAVDTHVHRISNRLGIVKSRRPEETDRALERLVPERYKHRVNKTFVAFGQTVCRPKNPLCGECPVRGVCRYYASKKDGQTELSG